MKYLYSRSLPGAKAPEPPKPKRKAAPKKPAAPRPTQPTQPPAQPNMKSNNHNPIPLPNSVHNYNIPERRINKENVHARPSSINNVAYNNMAFKNQPIRQESIIPPTAPANPVTKPISTPTVPMNQPTVPMNQPTVPMNQPTVPMNLPTLPMNSSSNPGFAPKTPVNTSSKPNYTPNATPDSLTTSTYTFVEPVCAPAKPMNTPAKPISAPAKPMNTPAKPMNTPAKPMNTPAKPISAPAKPMNTPAKPMNAPAKPMNAPAKPMNTPSKQVNTPTRSESVKKPAESIEEQNKPEAEKRVETLKQVEQPKSRARTAKKPKLDDDFANQTSSSTTSKKDATPTRSRGAAKGKPKTSAKTTSSITTSATTSATTTEQKQPAKRGRKRTIKPDDEEEEEREDITPQPTKKASKPRRQSKELPILNGTYKLSMVFQGHTDINVPVKLIDDDDLTEAKDIWCCEFEPPRSGPISYNIVAICGSYTVLFLDTQQGRYIKKFTHSEIQEIFYSMAWTTLSGADLLNTSVAAEESCNVLAVAGRLGSIKLLNPLQNQCYRYLFGHRQPVLKLVFAKTEPRWLFSASADKTVRLWDIGSPTSKDDDSFCLAKFTLPPNSSTPTALSISHDLSTLLVGFDDGDMVCFKITPQLIDKFRTKSAELRNKDSPTSDKWRDFGPIAIINHKTIYPKGGEWHEGYVDDIYIFGQDGDKSNKLYDKIISRGANDMEFIIWDPTKSTKTDADILVSLEWPDSAGCTGARYKVIEAEGQKVLVAGEYDGQIHIYNIGGMKKSKTLSDNSVEQMKATRMLSHPMSSELIRDVTCSHDTRTIVAVDNNNTAFVWNCTDNN